MRSILSYGVGKVFGFMYSSLFSQQKVAKRSIFTTAFQKDKSNPDIRNLKQALNHGLVLKKVHKVIKFDQNTWLKPYIAMNTDLTKKAKSDFEKYFFKLMNNAVFGKIIENVRKHRQ